jgi:hypothetical protein
MKDTLLLAEDHSLLLFSQLTFEITTTAALPTTAAFPTTAALPTTACASIGAQQQQQQHIGMKVTSFLTKDFSLLLFSQLTFQITTTIAAAAATTAILSTTTAIPTTACASIGAQQQQQQHIEMKDTLLLAEDFAVVFTANF